MSKRFFESIFYVYIFLDPRKSGNYIYDDYVFEYEPFYVGKGLERRIKQHLFPYKLKFNSPKNAKIKKLLSLGYEIPIVKIQENLIECQAFNIEMKLIKTIGRKDLGTGTLLNLNNGGKGGSSGRINTPEFIEKQKLSHLGRKNSITHVENSRLAHIGIKCKEETKLKISQTLKGRKYNLRSENKKGEF